VGVEKVRVFKSDKKEYDAVSEYLPQEGWLGDYLHFSDDLEACPRFRFFSACCVLGAVVNNKVWIHKGDPTLLPRTFPNPWVMLLAPPGRGHKTSTINMACNCLTQACSEVRILADKLTPESLVQTLSMPQHPKEIIRIGPRDATGLIKAPELSVFFGKQQYNTGLVSLVTDLYDYRETWSADTIGRGKNVLKNNCITVFGGSTPTWLQQMLPQDAFTGGFMRRFIIVEMPVGYYKRRAFPKKLSDTGWKELVKGMARFREVKGMITWHNQATQIYEKYYEEYAPTGDLQLDSYREGEIEQILKLSILLTLNAKRMEIHAEDLTCAKKILEVLREETDPRIERLTTHPRMHLTQEIQDLLKMYGELSEKELLKKVYRFLSLGERQFYETLSILRRAGVIEPIGKPGNYSFKLIEKGGGKK